MFKTFFKRITMFTVFIVRRHTQKLFLRVTTDEALCVASLMRVRLGHRRLRRVRATWELGLSASEWTRFQRRMRILAHTTTQVLTLSDRVQALLDGKPDANLCCGKGDRSGGETAAPTPPAQPVPSDESTSPKLKMVQNNAITPADRSVSGW